MDAEVAVARAEVDVGGGDDTMETALGVEGTVPVDLELVASVGVLLVKVGCGAGMVDSAFGVESVVLVGGGTVNVGAPVCGVDV